MFTSLDGRYVTVREVDVTTKAHQHHEGSPYSLFETTPRRHFSTTSGRPWGGLQTLTNFSEGNHKVRFLSEWLLLPRSLQPPRVTRTMQNAQNLLKSRNPLVQRRGRSGSITWLENFSQNAPRTLGNPGFRVDEWEREWGVFLRGSKWMVNLIPWKEEVYI